MSKLAVSIFRPAGAAKGAVEIIHGMSEHRKRYDDFAKFLCENGYAVYTFDLPGHGENEGLRGWFGEKDGWDYVLYSAAEVMKTAKSENPGIPFILFGHSMGTIVARCLLQEYDSELNGLVLTGAPNYQPAVKAGIALGKVLKMTKGARGHSAVMDQAVTGNFNKVVKDPKTPYDWISYNTENSQKYVDDPQCGFPFTIQGYIDELTGLERLHDSSKYRCTRKDLPILFAAGKDDPCIGGEAGFADSIATLTKAGYTDIDSKLYDGMRHEILNEIDHTRVYEDILNWIRQKV